jgi:NADH dehydrogenase
MDSSAKGAASTKHVVIVGAGFAGLNCARKLASDSSLRITLIDKNNYQQFQPLFYQVATGILSPENAAFNLRNVFFHHENVDVKMSVVVSVDLATRTVKGKSGDTYQGDFLVLAAGSEANFFGISGANTSAFPMYSLRDAERLRSRLLGLFEAADVKGGAAAANNLHFLVVGAGATGVETAGAIADILQHAPKPLPERRSQQGCGHACRYGCQSPASFYRTVTGLCRAHPEGARRPVTAGLIG